MSPGLCIPAWLQESIPGASCLVSAWLCSMTCLFLVVNINDVRQVELGDYINYYGVPQQPFSSRKAQWNSTSLPSVCKCWLSAWSSPGALGGARFPLVVFAEWVSSGALPDVSLRYQLHHSRAAGTPCSAKNNDHGTKLTSKIQAPKAGRLHLCLAQSFPFSMSSTA